jgi:hypothetical protein
MNRQVLISCATALALIAGAAGFLNRIGEHQVLAPPGVRTQPIPGSIRLQAELPERVLDYQSEAVGIDDVTLATLPKDTSFGMRRYKSPDGFMIDLRVVLMGRDRTSMHKPQICLVGAGWHLNDLASSETKVRVAKPYDYDLPVVKLVGTSLDAQNQAWSGIYVYWYVADDALSASTSGFQRMWLMAAKLLRTGVLQRWAYVSCLTTCPPGKEEAAFERVKQFIAAAAPEFQLYPHSRAITLTATP